jgi:hypothetical protein
VPRALGPECLVADLIFGGTTEIMKEIIGRGLGL